MTNKQTIKTIASDKELSNRKILTDLFDNLPIAADERVGNSGLFVKRQELSKMLFLNHLYQRILPITGCIMEFGVRWGQNMVTLTNLRGIYEPYSYGRKIIGFDTFEGFKQVSEKDGEHEIIKEGAFSVSENYEDYLRQVLECHEKESPLNHIKKTEVIKGDAPVVLKEYLEKHPETVIAFAYFDFDIYQPTIDCLSLILPHMPKGGVIAFDEITDPHFPGETIALKEVMDLSQIELKKNPFGGLQSYVIL